MKACDQIDLFAWRIPEPVLLPVTGRRILLAEDQEDVRLTIRLLLDVDSHTIVEAANGRDALAMFSPGAFDLVITDFVMPNMKGDELASRIKAISPSQPVLMITGSSGELIPQDLQVDALLEKPFDFASLRAAVAHVLDL